MSKNEAVCCWVQTHFGTFRLASLIKRFWTHFLDLCVQKRSCLLWSSDALLTFSPCMLYIKCSGRIYTIYASKTKLFAMKFRRILEVLCLQVLQKRFWVQFHDLCEQKWSGTHFGSFRLSSFIKKIMGAIPRFVRPKMKLFTVMFRYILEVLCLQDLQKKVWAQFHDLCVRERSCLLWDSDAFRKFSACKVYRKSSGRNSTIYVSKNEAVFCEVQTHFGSSRFAKFVKIFRAHYHDLCVQKSNCLPWCSDAFRKFSASKVYRESSRQIFTIYVSKTKLFAV